MQASCLEYLSLQKISSDTLSALDGAHAISQTLTPLMRDQIEQSLGIPIHQNYGLNEIGLVASRCIEGGRYHIHSEHCLVEITRDDGSLCSPGEKGRLLVTTLTNSAMPLIRYDADDLAEAVDGPCPCGRTLPSFGPVVGRYRRTAYLPVGTFQRWATIQLTLYKLTVKDRSVVRKYQAYQNKAGDFELRIDCEESDFTVLSEGVEKQFKTAYTASQCPQLVISRSDDFVGGGDRKFQNFISEFTPEMDQ
jgi:phenylacetate-CoA ligase